MEKHEYSAKKKKKKQLDKFLRVWDWIIGLALLLGLSISGSILVYQWWDRRQQIARLQAQLAQAQALQKEAQREYELQELNLISVASLAESPAIHSFFTDLLKTYSEKFSKSKRLDASQLPLKFESLYSDPQTGNGFGAMGRCFTETIIYPYQQKIAIISLNRLYLLNKLGTDRYFTSNDYSYIDISFDKMIDTCSHELAHYIQFIKHGKSSCKSDLILGNENYDEELAQEHKEWTEEIFGMIKQEYSEWEKRWKEI